MQRRVRRMASVLSSSLGSRFEVTTSADETFEGDLFCYDDKSDFAVFHIRLPHPPVTAVSLAVN